MADKKNEKIAAGLKLLKQYQKKNKDVHPENKTHDTSEPSLHEELPSSQPIDLVPTQLTMLSVENNSTFINDCQFKVPDPTETTASSFFTNSTSNHTNFFDTFVHQDPCNGNTAAFSKESEVNPVEASLSVSNENRKELDDLQTKNAELQRDLELERRANFELQNQLKTYQEEMYKIENDKKRALSNGGAKMYELEEKLVLQSQSIEILVSEKTDLQQRVERLEEEVSNKTAQYEDLKGLVSTLKGHRAELEREISGYQEATQQHNKILKKLETNLQEKNAELTSFMEKASEADMEIRELKRRLEAAFTECSKVQKQLEEKESRLSLAQIKLQQLGTGDGAHTEAVEGEPQDTSKELESLRENLEEAIREKDRNAHQYQLYISDLSTQLQELQGKFDSLASENVALKAREESLVAHISDLEKRMQQETRITAANNEEARENERLLGQIGELRSELDELRENSNGKSIELAKVYEDLENASTRIEELEQKLEEVQNSCPDAKLLQAAMESDKVAASRALAQNSSLKEQLSGMQQEFIRLSNNKLEIMEQLENEQGSNAKLREELERLRNLSAKEDDHCHHNHTHDHKPSMIDGCSQTTYHEMGPFQPNEPVSPEAMILLEEKFRKTMGDLAELSDEKQRLEHQVLQLQGETETICEYIALYQAQRALLQKRASEKDRQMALIAQEREELKKKLAELGALVPQLGAVASEAEPVNGTAEPPAETVDAARKIQSLWAEIGSSSFISDNSQAEALAFHPCPLCSGRLITV